MYRQITVAYQKYTISKRNQEKRRKNQYTIRLAAMLSSFTFTNNRKQPKVI